jgi:hypothetical protein
LARDQLREQGDVGGKVDEGQARPWYPGGRCRRLKDRLEHMKEMPSGRMMCSRVKVLIRWLQHISDHLDAKVGVFEVTDAARSHRQSAGERAVLLSPPSMRAA